MKLLFRFKYFLAFLCCITVLTVSSAKAQEKVDSVAVADTTETLVAPPVEESEGLETTNTKLKGSGFSNKDIYPELIEQRNLNNDSVKKLYSGEDFWYANAHPVKEKKAEADNESPNFWTKLAAFFGSDAVRVIAWILVALTFIAIIVSFVMSEGGLFKKSAKRVVAEAGGDEISENIFEIDFAKEIQKAVFEENYALSIRLLFLQSLKRMSEKGIIEYGLDKTNFDYLFSLNGSKYFNDFSKLVRNYEYAWYGKFPISKERFGAVEKNFNDYKNLIN